MRKILLTLLLILTTLSTQSQHLTMKVNPFIGTTNYGTTHPGAITPNGMMSVVPFNVMGSDLNIYDKDARWWSAPYEYTNKYFTSNEEASGHPTPLSDTCA